MAQVKLTLSDEAAELLRVRAEQRGIPPSELVTKMLSGDVPAETPLIELTKSQIASMDQTAERAGLTRKAWIEKALKERIAREYVQERQKQVFHA
ncbi:MAG TPA: hypothetical protein VK595_16985 [Vicinamibacterales bacterium]|nr:hypothetical protein [Vicinamibacterales bacterium]